MSDGLRFAKASLALFFVIALGAGGGAGEHRCLHDSAGLARSSSAAAHGQHGLPSNEPEPADRCACPIGCPGAVVVLAAPDAVSIPVGGELAFEPTVLSHQANRPSPRDSRALPFATAPPEPS